MTTEHLDIVSIGATANQYLQNESPIKFTNSTSNGAFLACGDNHIVFLSTQKYRGPLTANIIGDSISLKNITQNELAEVDSQAISFMKSGLILNISSATIWDTSPIEVIQPMDKNIRSVKKIKLVNEILKRNKLEGFSSMIKSVVAPEENKISVSNSDFTVLPNTSVVRSFLIEGEYEELSHYLMEFLGIGEGLTPSADDYILGVLLAFNRWGDLLKVQPNKMILNHNIINAARQKTNFISADLIRCASMGQADERLIQAVDYLAGTQIELNPVIDGLLGWGNSSGIAAFIGMTSVL